MKLAPQKVYAFRHRIFRWWKTHRRDLPWRRTHDPYRIFVSEVMLQQTQVLRVLPKYVEFIKAYATVRDLARAGTADVLRIWKGMGYNRRALYLQRAAAAVVKDYDGKFPIIQEKLVKLPGVGIYTARAILVFAYKQQVPLVDTNVRQIITHYFFDDVRQAERKIEEVAAQLVPPGKSWEWHQALMDYGSAISFHRRSTTHSSQPFKESSRFYRGRIIDRLREGNASEQLLLEELEKTYAKPVAFFRPIVASLVRDGLIERASRDILRLPE